MPSPRGNASPEALAAPACPSCGSSRYRSVLSGSDWEFGTPGVFFVFGCGECGWRGTWPPRTAAELATVYPSQRYYAYRRAGRLRPGLHETVVRLTRGYPVAGGAPWWLRLLVAAAKPALRRRYYGVPAYRPGGRLLDVGAGAGDFVAAAEALGWEAVGVEANEGAAGRAQEAGLAVVAGEATKVLTSGRLAGPFEVVRFHHTLEHLVEPAEALRAAAAATAPGGSLLVAVPNAGGVFARGFGRYWYHWALPFHRSHFDVASLRRLLRATGWRPRRVSFVSASAGVVRSLQWWLRSECGVTVKLGPMGERLAGFLLRPLIFLADVLGRGDNLIVEAEKP